MINDQEERVRDSIDWLRQNELDLLNRNLLDSLYSMHKSFKPFNKYEQDAFSYVLHHSEDCDWTIKWLEIWLVELRKGNVVGGIVLGPAFKRMITGRNSFCLTNSKSKTEEFLKVINTRFSEYDRYWLEK